MAADNFRLQSYSSSHKHGFARAPDKREILTLLPQLRLSLLHRSNHHITNTGIRQSVKVRTETKGFDDIKRLGTAVISAIKNGPDGETERETEFCARGTTYKMYQAMTVRDWIIDSRLA